MSLYSQFETDTAKEVEGIEVQYGPNKDKTIPTFRISRASKSNKSYSKQLEKATRPFRRQIDLGTMNNDTAENLFMKVFVNTILKGWQNVQNQKGEEIAFNEENAMKLFTDLPELYDDLQEKAKSASLFRDEAQEEEAGN